MWNAISIIVFLGEQLIIVWLVYEAIKYITRKPKLDISILKDDPVILDVGLQFEIVNLGNKTTTLYPVVNCTFETADGKRGEMVFDVKEKDLLSPSYGTWRFKAIPRQVQPERTNGKNKHYCFDHGKGAAIEVIVD